MFRHRLTLLTTFIVLAVAPASAFGQAGTTYGGAGQQGVSVVAPSSNPEVAAQGVPAEEEAAAQAAPEESAAAGSEAQGAESSAAPSTAAPRTTSQVSDGGLPFTGFDLALVAMGGLALLGLGFGMRRLSRQGPAPVA